LRIPLLRIHTAIPTAVSTVVLLLPSNREPIAFQILTSTTRTTVRFFFLHHLRLQSASTQLFFIRKLILNHYLSSFSSIVSKPQKTPPQPKPRWGVM
jgi:hypothetical protein